MQRQIVLTSAHLVAAMVIDSKNLVYRVDARNALAVFDGDVMLESECYAIDAVRNEMMLKRSPVFEIKVLVAARD